MTDTLASTPPAAAPRKWLRTAEAAIYCGLSRATLERYRATGDGPSFRKIGRAVVYSVGDLDDWLDAHRANNTAEARASVEKRRADVERRAGARAGGHAGAPQ